MRSRRGVMPADNETYLGPDIARHGDAGTHLLSNNCRAGAAFWLVRLGLICQIIQQQWRATAPLREDLLAITHWYHDEVDTSDKQELQTRNFKTATMKIKHFIEWLFPDGTRNEQERRLLGTLLHSGIGYCYASEMKKANMMLQSSTANVIHSAINMAGLGISFDEEDAIYEATMGTIIPWAQEKTLMMSLVDANIAVANRARIQLPIGGVWARTPATQQTHARLVDYATNALRNFTSGKTKAEAVYKVMRFVLLHGIVFRENYRGVRSPRAIVTPGTPLAWSIIVKSCPPPPEQTTGQPFAGATPVVMAAFAGLDNIVGRAPTSVSAAQVKETVVAFGLSWLVCRLYSRVRHNVMPDAERGLPLDYLRCKIGIFSRHESGWLTSVLPKLALGRVLGKPERQLPIKTATYNIPTPAELKQFADRVCTIEDIGRLAIDLHAKGGKFQLPVKLAARLHAIATMTKTPLKRDDMVSRMIWWVSLLFGCFYRSDSLRRHGKDYSDKLKEAKFEPPRSLAVAVSALNWTTTSDRRLAAMHNFVKRQASGLNYYQIVAGMCLLASGAYPLDHQDIYNKLFKDEQGRPKEQAFWAHGLPVYPTMTSACLAHLANEFGGVYGTMLFLGMFNEPEHRQEAMAVISHRLQYGIQDDEMGEQELDLVPHDKHYRDVTNWYQLALTIAQSLAMDSSTQDPNPAVIHDLTFIDDKRDVCPRPPPHQHVLSIWAADALLLALPSLPRDELTLKIDAVTIQKIRAALRPLLDPNFEMPVRLADGSTARIEGGASYFNPSYGYTCLRSRANHDKTLKNVVRCLIMKGQAHKTAGEELGPKHDAALAGGAGAGAGGAGGGGAGGGGDSVFAVRHGKYEELFKETAERLDVCDTGIEPVCEDFLTRLLIALRTGMQDLGRPVYAEVVVAIGVVFGLPCPAGVGYYQWLLSLCEMVPIDALRCQLELQFVTCQDVTGADGVLKMNTTLNKLLAEAHTGPGTEDDGTNSDDPKVGLVNAIVDNVYIELLQRHEDDPKTTGLLSTFEALFPISRLCNEFAWQLVEAASQGRDSTATSLVTKVQKEAGLTMKPSLQTALEKMLPFAPEPRLRRAL